MAEYIHGAYGQVNAVASRVADKAPNGMVVVGTAPVHLVAGGASSAVNKPIVVESIGEFRRKLGYSDDWAKYTLCEAAHVFFEVNGVAPLVFINVLDPNSTDHKGNAGSKSLTPSNGRITISDAESIILDTVHIEGKSVGTDFNVSYNFGAKTISIVEATSGALGTSAVTVTYDTIDATKVDADDVIGATDNYGSNTGLYAIKNVYTLTGYIPGYLFAPGWSQIKAVHDVMKVVSVKISRHWDAWMFVDMPIADSTGTAIGINGVSTWKNTNGYTADNETTYWPMVTGTDGKNYHLSTLAAANFQRLLVQNAGVPFHTASNTMCSLIAKLYTGTANANRVYDDEIINEYLNQYGICSAAFIGGYWMIWGAHAGDYTYANGDYINVAETTRMMLYYISNDFQARRSADVDQPLTANNIYSIVAEEQAILDRLVSIGALTYGKATLNAEAMTRTDMMMGDWAFSFNVTTTPLAKSLTAVVNWVDDGFETYFTVGE